MIETELIKIKILFTMLMTSFFILIAVEAWLLDYADRKKKQRQEYMDNRMFRSIKHRL